MRLLFVTGSLVHGGAERHAIALVNRLAERGHECHVAYVKNDPSQLERLRGAASVRCLEADRYFDLSSLKDLIRLVRSSRPSVIVAANPYALLYASLARRRARAGAALAVTFHTTIPTSAKEWLQLLYYRPLFWRADCLVFVCEAQRRYWRERRLFARRNETIHNGIDLEHWAPRPSAERAAVRRELGIGADELVLGMCAVFRPEKNHAQLVRAVACLARRGVDARALLIGDGPTRAAVQAQAQAAGAASRVVITGLREEVRPLIGACDAIAVCSDSETFSLAALEAMALARPVVHSDTGGAPEMIVPGETGFLFPVGDDGALVERLAALAEPRACERMGAAARRSMQARFSERAMVDRYERIFLELDVQRSNRENVRRRAAAY